MNSDKDVVRRRYKKNKKTTSIQVNDAISNASGTLRCEYETALFSCEETSENYRNLWSVNFAEDDVRCLCLCNESEISLKVPDSECTTLVPFIVETNVKVAVPNRFAAVISQMNNPDDESQTSQAASTFVTNGVIDSGYRGFIKVVIYTTVWHRRVIRIQKHGLKLRVALMKLYEPSTEERAIIDIKKLDETSDKFNASFLNSIQTVSNNTAEACHEPLLPCNGEKYWPGTTCAALVKLHGPSLVMASRYKASSNVIFIARATQATVAGLNDYPVVDPDVNLKISIYHSCEFATCFNFYSTFNHKRSEDAGYDIFSPWDEPMIVAPYGRTTVTVPQSYACSDGTVIPCIFGRSSMNSSGLVVFPTIWQPGEWCSFSIINMTGDPQIIEPNQRIAQLLLFNSDCPMWLPKTENHYEPFVRSDRVKHVPKRLRFFNRNYPIWTETRTFSRDVMPSERSVGCFGSTGK